MQRFGQALIFAVALAVGLAPAVASTSPSASDYLELPALRAGESLRLDFAFGEVPVSDAGPTNGLLMNLGGVSRSFLQGTIELYAGTYLLGSVTSSACVACGLFSTVASGYFFGTTVEPSGLDAIFNGSATATMIYTPSFSDGAGYIALSGWAPHAVTVSGRLNLVDVYPAPRVSYAVIASPAPEPEVIALWLVGLAGLMVATRRKNVANWRPNV